MKPLKLRCRICLAFICMTLVLIGVYLLLALSGINSVIDVVRGHVMSDLLAVLIEDMNHSGYGAAHLSLPQNTQLYGNDPRTMPIPARFADLPDGITNLPQQEDGESYVFAAEEGGYRYVIVRDDCEQSAAKWHLTKVILGVSFVIFLLAAAFSRVVSGLVIRPVKRLADAVMQAGRANRYSPLTLPIRDDEVGRLAQTCDTALRRLHQALERERTFTGDVSHELNSPLAVTESSLELLSMTALDEKQRRYVDRALSSVAQMNEVLTLFLAFARDANASDFEATDSVANMMVRIREIWEPRAQAKRVRLMFDHLGDCRGHFSPVLLGTVFSNLVKNAVAYSPADSTVRIAETQDGFIVEDEAGGIPPALRAKLFDTFGCGSGSVTLCRNDSHGIGLNLVKRVADRCGWQVECHDRTTPSGRRGTRFHVRLSEKSISMDCHQHPNENAGKRS